MPRHLIGDAHEWINEILTVPTHSLAKLQPSQRSWVSTCVLPFVSHELRNTKFYRAQITNFNLPLLRYCLP